MPKISAKNHLKNDKLFTLDWSRYNISTPIMKTKVSPVLIQLLQFYGNYSFYVLNWLKGKVRRDAEQKLKGFKRDLVFNAQKFTFDMMPTYLKDVLKFPGQVTSTHKLYTSLRDMTGV